MSERTFVDTNVLVYAVDAGSPGKRERALRILGDAERLPFLVISTQILSEFYAVVTRRLRLPLSPSDAERAVAELLGMDVAVLERDTVASAVARAARGGISIWDSLVIQAAVESGCTRLLSEDLQDGAVIDGVRVENPFRDAAA